MRSVGSLLTAALILVAGACTSVPAETTLVPIISSAPTASSAPTNTATPQVTAPPSTDASPITTPPSATSPRPTVSATPDPSPTKSSSPPRGILGLGELAQCRQIVRDGDADAPTQDLRMERGDFVGYLARLPIPQGILEAVQGRSGLVAGPFGPFVAFVDRRNGQAILDIVDAVRGCRALEARRPGFVFSPAVDPDRNALYFHQFSQGSTRRGEGTWRIPLGGGDAERVLPAWSQDARFDMTWSTTIAWTADGALVDQDCELAYCRTRVLTAEGSLEVYDRPVHGPFIRGTARTLHVYAEVCDTNDCAVVEIDRQAGEVIP